MTMPLRTLSMALAVALASGVSLSARAQFLADGGSLPCVQDSDCGGCGWACSIFSGTCEPATGTFGSCNSNAGCACAGQTCAGTRGDAGQYCLPTFQIQCICDSDCTSIGGGICDETTHACHPRPTACEYFGECGCGCDCNLDAGQCVCGSGVNSCETAVCLPNLLPDGGLTFGDAGQPRSSFIDGGIDAGILIGSTFCQQVGGSCGADGDCCSENCEQSLCTCVEGSDPGEYGCLIDSDCCTPATCSSDGFCFLDAGLTSPSYPGNTDPVPFTGSSSGKKSGSCAVGGGSASLLALLAGGLWLTRRKR
jgi:hypothetical protein